jgi:hypothetical protein
MPFRPFFVLDIMRLMILAPILAERIVYGRTGRPAGVARVTLEKRETMQRSINRT